MKPLLAILLGFPLTLFAQQSPENSVTAISLSELAAKSDLVALAQLRDTDYLTRRDIPVSGSAYLKILIPYKTGHPGELIEVYEKDLHEHECYFPEVSVFEEGRRYLLFLVRDADEPERYRGLAEGCALDVLVTSENRYALRNPPSGIALSDALDELAQDMSFADAYAIVDDELLPPDVRNSMLEAGQIRPYQAPDRSDNVYPLPGSENQRRLWQYTSGIPLEAARKLIDPQSLVD